MVDQIQHEASEAEKNLVRSVADNSVPQDEILRLIRELPSAERLVMKESWIGLASDGSLENWRRLEAAKLFVSRCLSYPMPLDDFVVEIGALQGRDRANTVDMTMGSLVPLERRPGSAILMANLPIMTSTGQISIYFDVRRDTNTVERAVVHPDMVDI
jgi:hypothetical protein